MCWMMQSGGWTGVGRGAKISSRPGILWDRMGRPRPLPDLIGAPCGSIHNHQQT